MSNEQLVIDGIRSEIPDGEILQKLIDCGMPYQEVKPFFNQVVKKNGLRLTAKERKALIDSELENFRCEDANDLREGVGMICDLLSIPKDRAERSIYAWAKRNNVEVYKRPIKSEINPHFGGIVARLLGLYEDDADLTYNDLKKYCVANELSTHYAKLAFNTRNYAVKYADGLGG